MAEPYHLRRWNRPSHPFKGSLYTCGRPGRSKNEYLTAAVPDALVDRWVAGLPAEATTLISLLGRKNSAAGRSEFSFYSFTGGLDTPQERDGRSTLAQWLKVRCPNRNITIEEFPTFDGVKIPPPDLQTIANRLATLLNNGETVVLIDSGGEQRTGQVCRGLGLAEAFPTRVVRET